MELISTLDIDLQEFGEKLMGKRKGSIVAIEPHSGENINIRGNFIDELCED